MKPFGSTISRPFVHAGTLSLLLLAGTFSATTHADKNCLLVATTPLEEAYCAVKASGKGGSLPEFSDFRKNPPSTQRLLLKKPARQAGVKLPPASPAKSSATANADAKKPQPEQPQPSSTQNSQTPQTNAPSTAGHVSNLQLHSCQLQAEFIACPHSRYQLQTNLPNSELNSDALSGRNRLVLADRNSYAYREATNLLYLSETYPAYIEKMLSIGLGDSTMSFTRYAAMFEEIQKRNGNFASRFTEMFELLKKEKATNAVRRRYGNEIPQSLDQCMVISTRIVVCDNITKNWVYRSDH